MRSLIRCELGGQIDFTWSDFWKPRRHGREHRGGAHHAESAFSAPR